MELRALKKYWFYELIMKSHLSDHASVVSTLMRIHPELMDANSVQVALSQSKVDELVKMVHAAGPQSSIHIRARHNFLRSMLDMARRKFGWDIGRVSRMFTVRVNDSTLSLDLFLSYRHNLKPLITACLPDLATLPTKIDARMGHLLFSLIVDSGIACNRTVGHYLSCLHKGMTRFGAMVWIEATWKETKKTWRPDTSGSDAVFPLEEVYDLRDRRFLHPVTISLIYRYKEILPAIPAHLDQMQLLDCLQSFLSQTAVPQQLWPISMGQFCQWAQSKHKISLPGVVAGFLSSRVTSATVSPETLCRLLTEKPVLVRRPDLQSGSGWGDRTEIKPLSGSNRDVKKQKSLYRELHRAVSVEASRQRYAVAMDGISAFLTKNSGNLAPIVQFLAIWAHFRLEPDYKGRPLRLARIEPSSVATYMSSIASGLIAAAGDIDLRDLEEDELLEVYRRAKRYYGDTNPRWRKKRINFGKTLIYFHQFLVIVYGIPEVDLSEFGGSVPPLLRVRANLLSPKQFDQMKELLAGMGGYLPRERVICVLSAVLGYRCGLRRGEIRFLRIMDIKGEKAQELLVCNTPGHQLKTDNSPRRVPVKVLLTEEEHQLLLWWYELRLREEGGATSGTLLFCAVGAGQVPLDDWQMFDPIETAMRQVTGDETISFRAMRHSFATWLTVCLLLDLTEEDRQRFPFLQHQNFDFERMQKLKLELLPNEALRRGAIYAVAARLGHASPATSLLSYIHCLDIVAAILLWRQDMQEPLTAKSMSLLTGLAASTVHEQYRDGTGREYNLLKHASREKYLDHIPKISLPKKNSTLNLTIEVPPVNGIGIKRTAEIPSLPVFMVMHCVQMVLPAIELIGSFKNHYHLSLPLLNQICRRAMWIISLKTDAGLRRHWSPSCRIQLGRKSMVKQTLADTMAAKFLTLTDFPIQELVEQNNPEGNGQKVERRKSYNLFRKSKQFVMEHIQSFLNNYDHSSGLITFATREDAVYFIDAMELLGIDRKHVAVIVTRKDDIAISKRKQGYALEVKPDQIRFPRKRSKGIPCSISLAVTDSIEDPCRSDAKCSKLFLLGMYYLAVTNDSTPSIGNDEDGGGVWCRGKRADRRLATGIVF